MLLMALIKIVREPLLFIPSKVGNLPTFGTQEPNSASPSRVETATIFTTWSTTITQKHITTIALIIFSYQATKYYKTPKHLWASESQ